MPPSQMCCPANPSPADVAEQQVHETKRMQTKACLIAIGDLGVAIPSSPPSPILRRPTRRKSRELVQKKDLIYPLWHCGPNCGPHCCGAIPDSVLRFY
mmetsp:Transcript_28910/g.50530  ORF Transcript_28910/g.50530 Transcript_28910/m.50530 type:complete len:98 (+) Transcript_28910:88-381(+)